MHDLDIHAVLTAGSFQLTVELTVARGPIVVVGPNGAGKTTLLRALAGGPVQVDGYLRVREHLLADASTCVPPQDRSVGYVPQDSLLFPHRSVRDNVRFGVPHASDAFIDDLLARFELTHLAHRRPRTLSGGEQQRVAIARALAPDPELLLFDEPTASLDVTARRAMRAQLAESMHHADRVAVVVTHDVRDVRQFGGTLVLLYGGQVLTGDRAADHPFVHELIDLPPTT